MSNQQETWTPAKLAEAIADARLDEPGLAQALSRAASIAKERERVKVLWVGLDGVALYCSYGCGKQHPHPFVITDSRIVGETSEERLRVMYRASLGHELTSDEYSVLQAWHLELRKANAAIAAARKEGA